MRFESEVRRELKAHGFTVTGYRLWSKNPTKYANIEKLALSNTPYKSIYGHNARIEFMLKIQGREHDILIEAKRQKTSGSVDEKFPYIYMNAINNLPERETMLVYQGDGWKPEAVTWVRQKAKETEGFYALNFAEFIAYLE